jgi:hypothetical protein
MTAAPPTPTAPAKAAGLRIAARYKLVPLFFFRILHGCDSLVAIEMVEDHILWPAFNLATRAGGQREIRIWRGCVEQYQPGQPPAPKPNLPDIITATLPLLGMTPAASATIPGADLARRFCLDGESIARLIALGELREVGRRNLAYQTPRISYVSVAQFLERRLV